MPEKSAKQRSTPFKETRRQHSQEAAQDYVELIYELIEEKGLARTCDIATHLGVSHVTALRTIRRIQAEGFVNTSPRKPVTLTKKGLELALFSKERHEVLLEFFLKLGVPKQQAEIDVEGAEHHISKVTLNCIQRFMKQE